MYQKNRLFIAELQSYIQFLPTCSSQVRPSPARFSLRVFLPLTTGPRSHRRQPRVVRATKLNSIVSRRKGFTSSAPKQIPDGVEGLIDSFYHFPAFKMEFSVEMLKHCLDEFGDNKRRMLTFEGEESSPCRLLCMYQDGSDAFI